LNALAVILANFGDTPQTTATFLGFGVYVIAYEHKHGVT
jgi:hypothetical protein